MTTYLSQEWYSKKGYYEINQHIHINCMRHLLGIVFGLVMLSLTKPVWFSIVPTEIVFCQ